MPTTITNYNIHEAVTAWITGDTSYGDINDWDVTGVTNMSGLFQNKHSFNEDISNWNTSNVTNMSNMFKNAYTFNEDINNWNTSNVTDMSNMFYISIDHQESDFNQNINNWNTSLVTNMSNMFNGSTSFNGDISNWNTSLVTNMSNMFDAIFVFNQDLSDWNVSNVTDMEYMFNNTKIFNQDIGNWNTSLVTNMSYMFNGAEIFDQDISDWNVSNVTNMSGLFQNANIFNQDIGNWNTSLVTNMSYMFNIATSFNQDISDWNTSNVTNMKKMFYGASSFNQDISNWDVANVSVTSSHSTNYMDMMFKSSHTYVNSLPKYYDYFTTYYYHGENYGENKYFYFNRKLTNDNIRTAVTTWIYYYTHNHIHIGQWDVTGVTDMTRLFRNVINFNENISNWNVNNVTDMSNMFSNARDFDISNCSWDITTNIIMDNIFSNDTKLQNWNNYMRNTIIKKFYKNFIDNITLNDDYMFAFFGDTEEQYDNNHLGFDISYNLLNGYSFKNTNNGIILSDSSDSQIDINGIIDISENKVSDINNYLQSIEHYSYIIDEYITRNGIGDLDNVTNFGNHHLALIKKNNNIKDLYTASSNKDVTSIYYTTAQNTPLSIDYNINTITIYFFLRFYIDNNYNDEDFEDFENFPNTFTQWLIYSIFSLISTPDIPNPPTHIVITKDTYHSYIDFFIANNRHNNPYYSNIDVIQKNLLLSYIQRYIVDVDERYPINLKTTPYFKIFNMIDTYDDNSNIITEAEEKLFGIKLFDDLDESESEYQLYAYGITKLITPKIPKYRWMFNNRTGCRFRIKC